MHKGHLTGCAVAIAAALIIFTVTGGSTGGLGLLLVVLICPITMGAAMWFLMGSQRRQSGGPTPHVGADAEAPPVPSTPNR